MTVEEERDRWKRIAAKCRKMRERNDAALDWIGDHYPDVLDAALDHANARREKVTP